MIVHRADWICPGVGEPIPDGALELDGGRIRQVGAFSEMQVAGEIVRHPGCVIVPGFVNAHAHLELSIFRGLLEHLSFADWIRKLVRVKYQRLSRDALKLSAQLGAIGMLRAGVTAVGEVMDVGAGWEALREFGLQGVAYQEVFGPADGAAEESLRGLRTKVDSFRPDETESLRIGVSPHAPYTVSNTLYGLVRDYARRESLRMTAHIAESRDETLFVRDGAGPFAENHRERGIDVVPRHCGPLEYLHGLDLMGPDMLLIHAIDAGDRDLDCIRDSRSSVVHCPRSNAKLEHGTARATEMQERGIGVSLGTDSEASNDSIDMFEEMRAAVSQQRGGVTAGDAFRMATIEGARSLGLDRNLGSLEVGKRADFAIVRLRETTNPIESLVHFASNADVRATYLAGRSVDLDDTEIAREVAAIAAKIE